MGHCALGLRFACFTFDNFIPPLYSCLFYVSSLEVISRHEIAYHQDVREQSETKVPEEAMVCGQGSRRRR